ncbi:MAG: bifunctional enoyl-CoA hydratase/phosphate acetyltransferase [Treponema sp.]|nr:bifunctional enoyl-CoA hydratase/phosphate acetyltransferase [Treponema sp.]
MVLNNFESLAAKVRGIPKRRAVVAAAADEHTLEAVIRASREGFIDYILVGNKSGILDIGKKLGNPIPAGAIVDAAEETEAAEKAVALIRQGRGDFLMKGKLETAALMRAVINKDTGIRKENDMSHMAIFEIPAYHKIIFVTDGGMIPYPDFNQKKTILKNALWLLRALGYDNPKVAVLAASETINKRMPETADAAALKELGEKGEFGGCVIEGPISFDLAFSKEAAAIKGYASPVTGEVDLLLAPNIAAGNFIGKSFLFAGRAKMAGCIVGAAVPVVLTSRGASAEEKHLSILLAAAVSATDAAASIQRQN